MVVDTLTNLEGAPMSDYWVSLYSEGVSFLSDFPTDSKGEFIVNNIPPGIYQVRFSTSKHGPWLEATGEEIVDEMTSAIEKWRKRFGL